MHDTHYVIFYTLFMEIKKWREAYIRVETTFGFLFRENLSRNEFMAKIKTLTWTHENKLDFDALNIL